MRKKGFTLVELLVVIVVISIIAAILLPLLGRARATARKTACRSNLKVIGAALLMYAGDYDSAFPSGTHSHLSDVTLLWSRGYVKDLSAFACPNATWDPRGLKPGDSFTLGVGSAGRVDQLYGSGVIAPGPSLAYSYDNQKRATDPAGVAVMADRQFGMDDDDCGDDLGGRYAANVVWEVPHAGAHASDSPFDNNSPNHAYEGQNVLYIDGHVTWTTTPACGLNGDNIYYWDGTWGTPGDVAPPTTDPAGLVLQNTDSYLTLNEWGYRLE